MDMGSKVFSASVEKVFDTEHGEDGLYEVTRFLVAVANPYGDNFNHFHVFSDEAEAHELADRVDRAIKDDPSWTPGEHWFFHRYTYGSLAYQNHGGEKILARACVEAEDGPGSYQPSHPAFIG